MELGPRSRREMGIGWSGSQGDICEKHVKDEAWVQVQQNESQRTKDTASCWRQCAEGSTIGGCVIAQNVTASGDRYKEIAVGSLQGQINMLIDAVIQRTVLQVVEYYKTWALEYAAQGVP